jgi:hypothetical protein
MIHILQIKLPSLISAHTVEVDAACHAAAILIAQHIWQAAEWIR